MYNQQKALKKYDIGTYSEIRGLSGLEAHHVGQKVVMKKFINSYDWKRVPAILVPKVDHTIRGPKGIVSRNSKSIDNGRQSSPFNGELTI
ncbi:hypothetical protein [Virgibacillus chiguensis]|uniref:Uncharacterized protein n=1 Tax=Virgibacillus chiguensis TaxID=411959 RepID=A0A1M5XFM2_9BACI|nr:hypothetical protein [Virgibacillus chiguensis]SHH98620.1 hypothetical protein SAMN05421807_12611 [Virgibacillus chiguensis]